VWRTAEAEVHLRRPRAVDDSVRDAVEVIADEPRLPAREPEHVDAERGEPAPTSMPTALRSSSKQNRLD